MEAVKSVPLTTFEISQYIHVDLTTVVDWCRLGKLKAYKTPGGHRRVQPEDFMEFLNKYEMPIPKEWIDRIQGRTKILIVDDEDEFRKTLRRVLETAFPQIQIYEAQDGFEAGKMALDYLPQLMILDLKMPGIDGFRVCSNIKKDERFEKTKILAVTGQDTDENRERIIKEGADDYLPKPFNVEMMIKKVKTLLKLHEGDEQWKSLNQ